MEINMDVVYEVFGYNGEIIDLVCDILERYSYEDGDEYDRLSNALDDGMCYTSSCWTMIQYYCNPQDADYNQSMEWFEEDLMKAINHGAIEE